MLTNYTWLPASMPDNTPDTLNIIQAHGSYLTLSNNQQVYDTISSWWCKPLGHCHPLVKNSIIEQLNKFEHHIPAKAYNENIEKLSQKLISFFTQMDKVMYASDGSSAIEIAMKLSYETRVLNNQAERYKFIALDGAYHGETIFNLSVCGINNYKTNYRPLINKNYFVQNIVYVTGIDDPLYENSNFNDKYWDDFFKEHSPQCTALIIEPLVQGANHLKIISKDFLYKLITKAQAYGLHIIADEIMVGLGRFACYSVSKEILKIEPDLVCFAKNLTAGSIPMSAIVINRSISNVFRKHNKIFPHSHTHSCNALAASVAINYLNWLEQSNIFIQIQLAEKLLQNLFTQLTKQFYFITSTRVIGSIAACDLNIPTNILYNIFNIGLTQNLYLRPIGNTLYLMLPIYNIIQDIEKITSPLINVLQQIAKEING